MEASTQGERHENVVAEPTSQGTPKVAGTPPDAGRETRNRVPLVASEGTNPANTLVLDVWPPGLTANPCLV